MAKTVSMDAAIAKFVQERDQMLEQFSVKVLETFMAERSPELFEPELVKQFRALSTTAKLLTLCEMVSTSTGVSAETKARAAKVKADIQKSYGRA